jgi:hypothetical protein
MGYPEETKRRIKADPKERCKGQKKKQKQKNNTRPKIVVAESFSALVVSLPSLGSLNLTSLPECARQVWFTLSLILLFFSFLIQLRLLKPIHCLSLERSISSVLSFFLFVAPLFCRPLLPSFCFTCSPPSLLLILFSLIGKVFGMCSVLSQSPRFTVAADRRPISRRSTRTERDSSPAISTRLKVEGRCAEVAVSQSI